MQFARKGSMKLVITLFCLFNTSLCETLVNAKNCQESSVIDFKTLALKLHYEISGDVFEKGSVGYEKHHWVHNGLCLDKYPDLIAVPKYTKDVSKLVIAARKFNLS